MLKEPHVEDEPVLEENVPALEEGEAEPHDEDGPVLEENVSIDVLKRRNRKPPRKQHNKDLLAKLRRAARSGGGSRRCPDPVLVTTICISYLRGGVGGDDHSKYLLDAFAVFDINGDGDISRQEFHQIMARNNPQFDAAATDAMFNDFDANGPRARSLHVPSPRTLSLSSPSVLPPTRTISLPQATAS